MTPAAILFCTTLVTAVPHGSVAEQSCRYIEPPSTGARSSVQEVPAQNGTKASILAPSTQTAQVSPAAPIPQDTQVASVAPVTRIAPVPRIASPISKSVVRVSKLNKPKTRRRIAHLTTFRRYSKVVVSPTANHIFDKEENISFWEKLKNFDLLK